MRRKIDEARSHIRDLQDSNPEDDMPVKFLPFLLILLLVPAVGAADGPAQPDVELTATDEVFGPLAEAPCTPEAVPGGIECVVDDYTVFAVAHPSLYHDPDDYRERRRGMAPVDPVELDGDYFYGIDNELLQFDDRRRAIVDRVRFPASIAELEAGDSALKVTIEAPPHRVGPIEPKGAGETGEETVTIDWQPGPDAGAPGRAPWDWTGTLGSLHDAMWLEGVELGAEPGDLGMDVETDPDQDRRAVASLERREQIDPTNPYIPLYRGEAMQRLGDDEAARQAYREAVDHEGADWVDRLRIGWRLELWGESQLAGEAFDGVDDEMRQTGVRGEYVTAMMNVSYAVVWLAPGMDGAVQNNEVETVDRLARRIDEVFPRLEGAPAAWGRLAAFFERRGDEERAGHWRQRADEIRGLDDRPDRLFEEGAEAVDLYLVLQIGLLLTAVLAGGLLGLRRYDENAAPEDESGLREYLPQFSPVDVVMLAGVFVGLVALPMMVAPQVQSMATLAEAPPAASGDAVAAPAVDQWVGELTESTARNDLIDESSAELQATREGTAGPGDLDLNRVLVEAIEADAENRELWRLSDVDVSEQTLQEFEWLRPLVEMEFDTSGLVLLVVVLGLNALILGALLQAAARRIDAIGRIGRAVVPGAPNSLRVLRFPVLAAFVVGLVLMMPVSRTIQASTETSLVAMYGLQAAPRGLESGLPTVGFALVVVALVVHAVGVVRDRR